MPDSQRPATWKENVGYTSFLSGPVIIIAAIYSWIEGLPPLTTHTYEVALTILIGVGLMALGLSLTWPRTPSKTGVKRKSR